MLCGHDAEFTARLHHQAGARARRDGKLHGCREELRRAAVVGRRGGDIVRGENQPATRRDGFGQHLSQIIDVAAVLPVEEIRLQQVQVDHAPVARLAAPATAGEMAADGPLDAEIGTIQRVREHGQVGLRHGLGKRAAVGGNRTLEGGRRRARAVEVLERVTPELVAAVQQAAQVVARRHRARHARLPERHEE